MQLVAINWHIYLLTKSAFALGMLGFARLGPLIIFSLIGGVKADYFDRKRIMLIAQAAMMLAALMLALASVFDIQMVWPIYILTAISSIAAAFDTPARQSLLPGLVPKLDFSKAVSLNLVALQIAMVIGPFLAGMVLSFSGPGTVYAINAFSFLAVIGALVLIRGNFQPVAKSQGPLHIGDIMAGVKFVRQTPMILHTMIIDFIATATASVTVLLPIFAIDILNVGPLGLGTLAAAPAVGAILTGVFVTKYGTGRRWGTITLISVTIYGSVSVAFGLSRVFWLSCILMALSGAADIVSSVTRQTTRQLITPDWLRGRVTSVNMIFFNGGPRLGELQAGLVAGLVGAPLAVVFGGSACLAGVIVMALTVRNLLKYEAA